MFGSVEKGLFIFLMGEAEHKLKVSRTDITHLKNYPFLTMFQASNSQLTASKGGNKK